MSAHNTLRVYAVGLMLVAIAMGGTVGCGSTAVVGDTDGRGTAGSTPGGRISGKTVKYTTVTTRATGYEPLAGVTVTFTASTGAKKTAVSDANGDFGFADLVTGKGKLQFTTGTGENMVPITIDSTPTQVIASVVPYGSIFATSGGVKIAALPTTIKPQGFSCVFATLDSVMGPEIVWVMKTKTDANLVPTFLATAPLVTARTQTGSLTVQALTKNLSSNIVTIKVAK